MHPNQISTWWKTILEAGKDALSGSRGRKKNEKEKLIKHYQEELSEKNEVIAELSRELLELKKKRMARIKIQAGSGTFAETR